MLFNPSNHPVHVSAATLLRSFEKSLRDLVIKYNFGLIDPLLVDSTNLDEFLKEIIIRTSCEIENQISPTAGSENSPCFPSIDEQHNKMNTDSFDGLDNRPNGIRFSEQSEIMYSSYNQESN